MLRSAEESAPRRQREQSGRGVEPGVLCGLPSRSGTLKDPGGGGDGVRSVQSSRTAIQTGVWDEFGEVNTWLPPTGHRVLPVPCPSVLDVQGSFTYKLHNLPGLSFPMCNIGFLHIYLPRRPQIQPHLGASAGFSLRGGPLAPSGGTSALCR